MKNPHTLFEFASFRCSLNSIKKIYNQFVSHGTSSKLTAQLTKFNDLTD